MWQRSQNSALQQCRSLNCSYLALVQNSGCAARIQSSVHNGKKTQFLKGAVGYFLNERGFSIDSQ